MFKNRYDSYLNTPFISFSISTTPCLRMVKFYQQMSQSNSFTGNDFMVLFNWDCSCLINKLSLRRSLNLFALEVRTPNRTPSLLNSYIQVDDQMILIL